MDLGSRVKRLIDLIDSSGYGSCVIARHENLYYLTGYWGAGIGVLGPGGLSLYVPRMEFDRAVESAYGCEVIEVGDMREAYERGLSGIDRKRICLDSLDPVGLGVMRREGMEFELDPGLLYSIRAIKDEAEIERIRRACSVIDRLFSHAEGLVRPGVSEREIVAGLVKLSIEMGSWPAGIQGYQGPFIVATGPNSSYPHALPGGREIARGDFVLIDIFVRCEGYVADATRTFHVGQMGPEEEDAYMAVLEAQEASLELVREGIEAFKPDEKAREILGSKGYEQFFTHSLGHGVGLEIHEPPRLASGEGTRLVSGNVVTVEPGIYIGGRFGIRIEDTVLVGKRPERMTNYTREPIIL